MNLRPVSASTCRLGAAPSSQRGVGLIEVLVAVLILSIGLLGISMMQGRALSANNNSAGVSMTVVASYSILEAMRADRLNALAGAYNRTVTGNSSCTLSATTTTLATAQLNAWCADLRTALGTASTTTGTIACTADNCTITIQFDDSRLGAGGSTARQVITRAVL